MFARSSAYGSIETTSRFDSLSAKPTQIRGDHSILICQRVDLSEPHLVIEWKTVHEQQRRATSLINKVESRVGNS